MKHKNYTAVLAVVATLFVAACNAPLLQVHPDNPTDTSNVVIIVNSELGNRGLLDYDGDVFVHLGVITDSSVNDKQWRYVKFKWGSADRAAYASRVGENTWSYTVFNPRKFFGVSPNEKILKIAVLFRQGNCVDTLCRTLRNEDKSDFYIPINTQEKK